jgi:hypothetical protein
MAALLFRHFSLTTLEAMLEAAASAVEQGGRTVISYSEAGRTVTKSFALSYADYLDEVNAALEAKDPEKYGPRIDSTRVSFNRSDDGNGRIIFE